MWLSWMVFSLKAMGTDLTSLPTALFHYLTKDLSLSEKLGLRTNHALKELVLQDPLFEGFQEEPSPVTAWLKHHALLDCVKQTHFWEESQKKLATEILSESKLSLFEGRLGYEKPYFLCQLWLPRFSGFEALVAKGMLEHLSGQEAFTETLHEAFQRATLIFQTKPSRRAAISELLMSLHQAGWLHLQPKQQKVLIGHLEHTHPRHPIVERYRLSKLARAFYLQLLAFEKTLVLSPQLETSLEAWMKHPLLSAEPALKILQQMEGIRTKIKDGHTRYRFGCILREARFHLLRSIGPEPSLLLSQEKLLRELTHDLIPMGDSEARLCEMLLMRKALLVQLIQSEDLFFEESDHSLSLLRVEVQLAKAWLKHPEWHQKFQLTFPISFFMLLKTDWFDQEVLDRLEENTQKTQLAKIMVRALEKYFFQSDQAPPSDQGTIIELFHTLGIFMMKYAEGFCLGEDPWVPAAWWGRPYGNKDRLRLLVGRMDRALPASMGESYKKLLLRFASLLALPLCEMAAPDAELLLEALVAVLLLPKPLGLPQGLIKPLVARLLAHFKSSPERLEILHKVQDQVERYHLQWTGLEQVSAVSVPELIGKCLGDAAFSESLTVTKEFLRSLRNQKSAWAEDLKASFLNYSVEIHSPYIQKAWMRELTHTP
jgi:hypothetical protein